MNLQTIPTLTVCADCAKEQNLDYILSNANKEGKIKVTHGLCKRHMLYQLIKLGKNPVQARHDIVEKEKTRQVLPDLMVRKDLVRAYSAGDFTLKERIQKLAGL